MQYAEKPVFIFDKNWSQTQKHEMSANLCLLK